MALNQSTNHSIWAIVPAAGIGKRMQSTRPKQYLALNGRPVLEHSINTLLNNNNISGLVIALQPDDAYWPAINITSTKPVIKTKGGKERAIMNFAKTSQYMVDNLKFDIWDFALKDNFSLMWSKFIKGSDLVILLFDLSNYHIRVINHFLNLQKQESKFSKLLILGTKRDLVEDKDIKLIKNELNIPHFEEISLVEVNIKKKIKSLIAKMLSLKKYMNHFSCFLQCNQP